jgi:hypothetical protein
VVTICLIVGYAIIIFAGWRWVVFLPFKLLTVFLHEFSHATAVWLTCGKVTGMEVNANEGGVTKHRGGFKWIIIPAGYLGSGVWGGALLAASATHLGSFIAAIALVVVMVLFGVIYADNNFLRGLCVGFTVLLTGIICFDHWVVPDHKIMPYVILFMGTMNCLFSVYDIHDDLISRRVNGSDAVKFAELVPGTSSRCWGMVWGIISCGFLVMAIYLNLVQLEIYGTDKKVTDYSTGGKLAVGFPFVACLIVALSCGCKRYSKRGASGQPGVEMR